MRTSGPTPVLMSKRDWNRAKRPAVVQAPEASIALKRQRTLEKRAGSLLKIWKATEARKDAAEARQIGWCPGVRVLYGRFGGATVHGDVAYSTWIYSLFFMPPTQRTNPNLHQGCQGRRPIGFHRHCVRIGSREQIRSPANKVSLSHHSVTVAVDGELCSAPLEDDKLKASHQS